MASMNEQAGSVDYGLAVDVSRALGIDEKLRLVEYLLTGINDSDSERLTDAQSVAVDASCAAIGRVRRGDLTKTVSDVSVVESVDEHEENSHCTVIGTTADGGILYASIRAEVPRFDEMSVEQAELYARRRLDAAGAASGIRFSAEIGIER